MDISNRELKIVIGKLLDEDSSKKFSSIVDICLFLWEIVDKIMEGVNDKNMSLQQKEDLAVLIANSVVNFLEERGMITVELAEKSRSLINTADVFLDLLLGLKGVGSLKQMVTNPTKESCFKGICAIFSCFTSKNGRVPTPNTGKPKLEFTNINSEPVAEAQPEPVAEVQPEPVAEAQPEPVAEAQPEPVAEVQPEPVAEVQPEPVAEVQPEPVAEVQPEPAAEVQPEPVAEAKVNIKSEEETIKENCDEYIEEEKIFIETKELVN